MKIYTGNTYDEERALYGIENATVENCIFEGPADGESALKETKNISVKNCIFKLRYPFWHTIGADISGIEMTETCRAALWYDKNVKIKNSILGGIKAMRECDDFVLDNCKINSTEFGWFCNDITVKNSSLSSEYPFLKCSNMEFDKFEMNAKYSFQYVENIVIKNSILNTKDAFWHGKNITVYDSEINGEYLGWYSDSIRLVNCKIKGTQPFCYATNLILENCEMIDCDLSFEKSSVKATIKGKIDSVKNPESGFIHADEIGEIIIETNDCQCEIKAG